MWRLSVECDTPGDIPVGVLVERSKSASPWVDFHWHPIGVLIGVPDAAPWTKLSDNGERATFYVGAANVELYRTETANYRDNLNTEAPQLWIVLRPVERDPPYELALVTADPAEAEAMTKLELTLLNWSRCQNRLRN